MAPFAGGAARLARDGLHHHLDLDLAGRGVHPDLLHAGRDRPAVPRVRGRRVAGDRGLGGRLADAGADAGEPLPEATRRSQDDPGCACVARGSSAASTRLLGALHARARLAPCATAASCCWSRWLTFVATAWLFVDDPKGFFPEEDIGQIQRHDRGGRGHLVPGDGRSCRTRRRRRCAPTRTWRRQLVQRRGGRRHAEHRPPVHQPEAARRARRR